MVCIQVAAYFDREYLICVFLMFVDKNNTDCSQPCKATQMVNIICLTPIYRYRGGAVDAPLVGWMAPFGEIGLPTVLKKQYPRFDLRISKADSESEQ